MTDLEIKLITILRKTTLTLRTSLESLEGEFCHPMSDEGTCSRFRQSLEDSGVLEAEEILRNL